MKKFMLNLITILVIFIQIISAHFEDMPVSARIAGLNNSSVALADDIFSSYVNPAGLENLEGIELGFDYNRLLAGLSDGSNISSSLVLISKKIKQIGSFLAGFRQFGLIGYYTENKYTLSYAKLLNINSHNINLGVKLNILSKTYSKTDYTENATNLFTGSSSGKVDPVFSKGYSKTNFSLDIGAIYRLYEKHTFGVLFENLNQPDLGLYQKDILSLNFKVGYSLRLKDVKFVSDILLNSFNSTFSLGIERYIPLAVKDKIILRGGFAFGERRYFNFSLGGSYEFREIFIIHYGFSYLLSGLKNSGSHQASVAVKFK